MSVSACTLQCLYAYSTRTDIRRKYNLEVPKLVTLCPHTQLPVGGTVR